MSRSDELTPKQLLVVVPCVLVFVLGLLWLGLRAGAEPGVDEPLLDDSEMENAE